MSDLKKKFLRYVAPNIGGMIGISCYILADTYYIAGRMGADGLAALNLALPLYGVMSATGLLLGVGGATRYTILRARGKEKEANDIFTLTLVMGALAGLFYLLAALFFTPQMVDILGGAGNIVEPTQVYLKTMLVFSPFFILNNILNAFVRNDGAPQLAMGAMLAGSFSNIVLDYVFIYPLSMGMFGAALASGLAPLVDIMVLSSHFRKKEARLRLGKSAFSNSGGWVRKSAGTVISLGFAAFLNELSSGIVLFTFNRLILRLVGNVGVAAYGIIANIALVSVAVFTGIAQGAQPLISSYYGKGESRTARKVFLYAVESAVLLAVVQVGIAWGFTQPLVEVFNSEGNKELAQIAQEGLRLYYLGFLPASINIVAASCLASVERAKESFVIAIFRGCIGIMLFAVILSYAYGLTGVWLSFAVTEVVALLLVWELGWKRAFA